MYSKKQMKPTALAVAVTLALGLGAGAAQATITTTGNNFTMGDGSGGVIGGTNDVVFSWDGTYKSSVAASGQVSNASLSSTTTFFAIPWTAHDLAIYGPGTYTIGTGCPAGSPGCGIGPSYTFTVGLNQVGAHMLFDWNGNLNIDVVDVWNYQQVFGPQPMFISRICTKAGCVPSYTSDPWSNNPNALWDGMSTDWDGNGWNGGQMIDGPFMGAEANFNVMGIHPAPSSVPVPAAAWLFTSGLLGLVGTARRKERK